MFQQQTVFGLSLLLRPGQLCIFVFVFVLIFRRMYTGVLVCIRYVPPRLHDLNTQSSAAGAVRCDVEGLALLEKVCC